MEGLGRTRRARNPTFLWPADAMLPAGKVRWACDGSSSVYCFCIQFPLAVLLGATASAGAFHLRLDLDSCPKLYGLLLAAMRSVPCAGTDLQPSNHSNSRSDQSTDRKSLRTRDAVDRSLEMDWTRILWGLTFDMSGSWRPQAGSCPLDGRVGRHSRSTAQGVHGPAGAPLKELQTDSPQLDPVCWPTRLQPSRQRCETVAGEGC